MACMKLHLHHHNLIKNVALILKFWRGQQVYTYIIVYWSSPWNEWNPKKILVSKRFDIHLLNLVNVIRMCLSVYTVCTTLYCYSHKTVWKKDMTALTAMLEDLTKEPQPWLVDLFVSFALLFECHGQSIKERAKGKCEAIIWILARFSLRE